MLWTHLIYVNEHSYGYQDQFLRVFVIFLVALRDCFAVILSDQALPIPPTQEKLRNFNRLAIFTLAGLLFFCVAAREDEILKSSSGTRDKFVLIWTNFVTVVLLVYHGLFIGSLRLTLQRQQQYPRSQEFSRANSLMYALGAIMGAIIIFATIDLLLLISWIQADEYGRDILSKTWQYRWFLVNEWQTVTFLADIATTMYT